MPYFYDAANAVSSWEEPAGLTAEQIDSLPGAHYLRQPGSVRASHILVKHAQSRRPSSHRQANITRSPQEAEAAIRSFIEQLGPSPDPALFAKLATEHRFVSFSSCAL